MLPLALGIAGLALYVLASGGRPRFLEPSQPPMDEISDVSRLRLESVLLDADREAQEGR